MENWISVKDRLPENDDRVLVWENKFGTSRPLENGCWEFAYYDGKWEDMNLKDYENNADYILITHWMPLPPPPMP